MMKLQIIHAINFGYDCNFLKFFGIWLKNILDVCIVIKMEPNNMIRNDVRKAIEKTQGKGKFHLSTKKLGFPQYYVGKARPGVTNPDTGKPETAGQRCSKDHPNAVRIGSPNPYKQETQRSPQEGVSRAPSFSRSAGVVSEPLHKVPEGKISKFIGDILSKIGLADQSQREIYNKAKEVKGRLTRYSLYNRKAGIAQKLADQYETTASETKNWTERRKAKSIASYYEKIASAQAKIRDSIKFDETILDFVSLADNKSEDKNIDSKNKDELLAKVVKSGALDDEILEELEEGAPTDEDLKDNKKEVHIKKE